MTSGIYMIKNKNTGQIYIGQSVDIERRFKEHKRYKTKGSYIDGAINKYGCDIFDFIIVYITTDIDLMNELEQYYIWKYNTFFDDNHYNLTSGGDNCIVSFLSRQKMSIAKQGKYLGKDNPFYGKHHTLETKKHLSDIHHDVNGENNPMYNKKHTFYSKIKMSKARNTSGFYRVSKVKDKRHKKGFYWVYIWHVNGQKKSLASSTIDKLKEKVLKNNLQWIEY